MMIIRIALPVFSLAMVLFVPAVSRQVGFGATPTKRQPAEDSRPVASEKSREVLLLPEKTFQQDEGSETREQTSLDSSGTLQHVDRGDQGMLVRILRNDGKTVIVDVEPGAISPEAARLFQVVIALRHEDATLRFLGLKKTGPDRYRVGPESVLVYEWDRAVRNSDDLFSNRVYGEGHEGGLTRLVLEAENGSLEFRLKLWTGDGVCLFTDYRVPSDKAPFEVADLLERMMGPDHSIRLADPETCDPY
jgi:hypothetical protein